MKKITLDTLFISLFLLLSSNAFSQQPSARIDDLNKSFNRIYDHCPSFVWPNLKPSNFRILMVQPNESHGWIWAQNHKLKSISSSQIPKKAFSSFSFIDLFGYPTLTINLSRFLKTSSSDEAFLVGVHEAFHKYWQHDFWKSKLGATPQRKLFYPYEWKPRFIRRQLLKSLFSALQSKVGSSEFTQYLEAASFWNDKFEKSFPNEYKITKKLDLIEGTARYVERRSQEIDLFGCQPTNFNETLKIAKENIDLSLPLDGNVIKIWAPEVYEIGYLSGLILDKMSVKNWKQDIVNNPIAIHNYLLNSFPKKNINVDAKEAEKFKKFFSDANQKLLPKLDPLLSGLNSDYYRLAFAPTNSSIEYGSIVIKGGILHHKNFQDIIIYLNTDLKGSSKDGKNIFNLKDASVFRPTGDTPCGKKPWVVPILKSAVQFTSNQHLSFENSHVKALGKYSLKKDSSGTEWICAL